MEGKRRREGSQVALPLQGWLHPGGWAGQPGPHSQGRDAVAVCSWRGAPVPAAPTRHTQHSSTPTSTRGPATNLQPRHSTRPSGVTLCTDSNVVSGRHSYSLQLRPLLHPQHSRRQQASPSVTPRDFPRPLGHIRDLPRPLGHTSGCPTTPRSHQGPPVSPQSHLGTSRDPLVTSGTSRVPSVTSGTSRVPWVTPRDVPRPLGHTSGRPLSRQPHRGCPASPSVTSWMPHVSCVS